MFLRCCAFFNFEGVPLRESSPEMSLPWPTAAGQATQAFYFHPPSSFPPYSSIFILVYQQQPLHSFTPSPAQPIHGLLPPFYKCARYTSFMYFMVEGVFPFFNGLSYWLVHYFAFSFTSALITIAAKKNIHERPNPLQLEYASERPFHPPTQSGNQKRARDSICQATDDGKKEKADTSN